MAETHKKLRIIYAAGPGNVLRTYQFWAAGVDDPQEVAVTYSAQFLEICRELNCKARVLSYHGNVGYQQEGDRHIEHRPMFPQRAHGPMWHAAQVLWGLRFILSALRFRADVAVVSSGSHGFIFALLPLVGIKVIPTMHCVLWTKHRPPHGAWKIVHRLNAKLFQHRASAILSISNDVTAQMNALTGGKTRPIVPFLPYYRRETFAGIARCEWREPFHVLYAGRMIRSKGIFDLLEAAVRLQQAGKIAITFDLCGDGQDLGEIRKAAEASGLLERFRCHGHCSREQMRDFYGRSQVVVVPTRTDFIEGFNKVLAEAILAGRPAITSKTCPALEYVKEAVVETECDDVAGLEGAISRLYEDQAFFAAKVDACHNLQEQFYDSARNWASAFRHALAVAIPSRLGKESL